MAFLPMGDLQDDFNFWCEAIYYAGRYVEPLDAIAEELADVSTPGKAPLHWGILVRRGLKRGITIYAISQRWARQQDRVWKRLRVRRVHGVQQARCGVHHEASDDGSARSAGAAAVPVHHVGQGDARRHATTFKFRG
ncbi:MAG: hypothetical protein QM771_19020 [Nitrospira sp.]